MADIKKLVTGIVVDVLLLIIGMVLRFTVI